MVIGMVMVWWHDRILFTHFVCMWERWGILGSGFSKTVLAFLLKSRSWEKEYSGVFTPRASVHSSVDVQWAGTGGSQQLTMFKPYKSVTDVFYQNCAAVTL